MTDYTRSTNAAVADTLQQAKEINLAAIAVLKSLTSVMVPLGVSALPQSGKIIPTIDGFVDRGFDTIVKVVESQYHFGAAALEQLGAAA